MPEGKEETKQDPVGSAGAVIVSAPMNANDPKLPRSIVTAVGPRKKRVKLNLGSCKGIEAPELG